MQPFTVWQQGQKIVTDAIEVAIELPDGTYFTIQHDADGNVVVTKNVPGVSSDPLYIIPNGRKSILLS